MEGAGDVSSQQIPETRDARGGRLDLPRDSRNLLKGCRQRE